MSKKHSIIAHFISRNSLRNGENTVRAALLPYKMKLMVTTKTIWTAFEPSLPSAALAVCLSALVHKPVRIFIGTLLLANDGKLLFRGKMR